jgi:hypothetical protein
MSDCGEVAGFGPMENAPADPLDRVDNILKQARPTIHLTAFTWKKVSTDRSVLNFGPLWGIRFCQFVIIDKTHLTVCMMFFISCDFA